MMVSLQIGGLSRPVTGPPMKITVTGNVTRGSSGTPVSTLGGHTQKVILVSTSGASGVGSGMYQRSLSVPVMKGAPGGNPTVLRGVPAGSGSISSGQMQTGGSISSGNVMVPTTFSSGGPGGSGGGISQAVMPQGTYVNRMRPRIPSGAIPARPRQRSNSLVLHTEPTMPQRGLEQSSGSVTSSLASSSHMSSVPGYSGAPPGILSSTNQSSHNVPPGHLMTHQTIQVRPSTPVTPGKAAIQIRQEGTGAKIITHSVGATGSSIGGPSIGTASGSSNTAGGNTSNTPGRLIGRPPLLPPTSPQGAGGPLYVVTTNSGTITVVTRTVAAGQGTGPRVVTVNTITAPKSSVGGIRTASPATVVSVGPKTVQTVRVTPQGPTGLRPMLGGAKSNVIVVHKGAPPGTRPIGIQGIRDVPTKITIGKTLSGSSNAALLQKPPPVPRGTVSTASVVTAGPSTSQGNVIVVDMSGTEGSTVSNANPLSEVMQATGEYRNL
ncbi:hypothetical protein SK128_019848 [Halocaridina rubra]|uniref:Uncharacterized protein n=1 Tax=Halocaridina rubra TaxID=373956 RepID=A0AAN8X627_HALRR